MCSTKGEGRDRERVVVSGSRADREVRELIGDRHEDAPWKSKEPADVAVHVCNVCGA